MSGSYVRKTRDEDHVQGLYCGEWETVTIEASRAEAVAMCKCYNENELTISHRVVKNG